MKGNYRIWLEYTGKVIDMLEDGEHFYCEVYHDQRGYIGETPLCNSRAEAKEAAKSVVDYDIMGKREVSRDDQADDF